MPSSTDLAYVTRRLARTVAQAEHVITRNAAAIERDLGIIHRGIREGHSLSPLHGQQRDDLNRAIVQRQAAWDTARMLEIGAAEFTAAITEEA